MEELKEISERKESVVSAQEGNFEVFPNPFSNVLHFSFGKDLDCCMDLLLFDENNKLVLRKRIPGHINTKKMTLPVEELSPGEYLLKLKKDGSLFFRKIIKE